MKIITLFLVITTVYYVQAQGGNILNFIFGSGGALRGGTPCNCKCGVSNMEVRRRSDEASVPEVAKAPENNGLSEEVMMAIAEDAKFTELLLQAEEMQAQQCKCDQPKEAELKIQKEEVVAPAVVAESKKEEVVEKPKAPVLVEEFKKAASEKKARLLAGDTPPPHEFPWMAMIQVVGKQPVAGGALITDRHIITAASPLIGVAPHNVKVSLGVHDRCDNDATSTNISVTEIHRHPSFSAHEEAHDLALLELAATVRFDSRIHPICLPVAAASHQGQVTTIVSWQEPVVGSPPGCLPKRIHLPVLSREECVKGLISSKRFTPEKSCIGSFGSGAVVCPADVGTPVQYLVKGRYYLLGVMGSNTCVDNSSTLFTRVTDHLNWIGTTVKNDCICSRS